MEFSHMLLMKGARKEKRIRWVVEAVSDQTGFDELFKLLFHHERSLVLRAAEAVEKVTAKRHHFLVPHKDQVFALFSSGDHKELKPHVVKLLPRLELTANELTSIWNIISYLAKNPNENKTVRAGALQTLYELTAKDPSLINDLHNILNDVAHDAAPSIQAKVRKLNRKIASVVTP